MVNKIIVLVSIILIIDFCKSSITHKNNGEPREWGIGRDSLGYSRTLIDMRWIIIVACLILAKRTF